MKKIIIITSVLVLLIGVVLSIALYGNSPFNKVKANDVYEEDENSSAVSKESDNSDGVPYRVEVSGDAVQPENDILSNSGDDEDSSNQDNFTYDSNNYGDDDNDNSKEHHVEYDIKLKIEPYAKSILASKGTEAVYFYAETFIETEEIFLVDANTGSTVATMVDDGRCSKNGDELMNDNVYTCKVDIDISKEKIYEFYAVIGDTGNDAIISNTVKIKVYTGFTEKDIFDNEQVFTAIDNLFDSDEFKSMDLDGRIEAMYELLVELSENGTPEAPYSLIKRESIRFDKENCQYTFVFHRGGIVVIPLVDNNELHGN